MPHKPGPRSKWDQAYDTVKPFLEGIVRKRGGTAVFKTPLLGEILKALRAGVGPAPFAAGIKAAAGWGHIPRSFFPDGGFWDIAAHAVNEIAIDTLGNAISEIAELPDAEFEARLGALLDERVEETLPKPSAELFMVREYDTTGAVSLVTIHEGVCPLFERTVQVSGGKGGPRRVPNPRVEKGPREHVLALVDADPKISKCPCVDRIADQVAYAVREAKKASAAAPKFMERLGKMAPDVQQALIAAVANLPSRLVRVFWTFAEERLTTPAMIEQFIALDKTAQHLLVSTHESRISVAAHAVLDFLGDQRKELQGGIDAVNTGLVAGNTKLAALRERLAARTRW